VSDEICFWLNPGIVHYMCICIYVRSRLFTWDLGRHPMEGVLYV